MSTPPIRILIGDDHPIVLDALCTLLNSSDQFTVVATACSFHEVLMAARHHPADVVILDLGGMGDSPLAIVQHIQKQSPRLRIIVFSSMIDLAPELLSAGASGYVVKEERSSVLIEAIIAVAAGEVFQSPYVQEYLAQSAKETPLKPKELTSLKLLAQGLATHEIAATMCIDPRTVQNYITSMLRKTGCAGRVQLVEWYRRAYVKSS